MAPALTAPPSPFSIPSMVPIRPPTQRQEDILRELASSNDHLEAIAKRLDLSIHTARGYVREIALSIPNPHGLPALRLVRAFAIARTYETAEDDHG